MTDIEFDLLDQLYFVQTFEALVKELQVTDEELKNLLIDMVQKGWVKVMDKQTDEEIVEDIWRTNCSSFFYLATKKGLFAHNTI